MSSYPTGAAGIANIQKILGSTNPQTGDAGIVAIQELLAAGGAGGGGMVPAGSTGITTFTTNGTSGASTYNSTTGAMNVPAYAGMVPGGSTGITIFTTNGTSGAATYNSANGAMNIPNYATGSGGAVLQFNFAQFSPTTYSTTSTSMISTGQGLAFTPVTAQVIVTYSVNLQSAAPAIGIYRTTTAIPVAGTVITPIPANTVQITYNTNSTTAIQVISGSEFDIGLTPGTPYNYYLGMRAASGTLVLNASTAASIQVGEYHL